MVFSLLILLKPPDKLSASSCPHQQPKFRNDSGSESKILEGVIASGGGEHLAGNKGHMAPGDNNLPGLLM